MKRQNSNHLLNQYVHKHHHHDDNVFHDAIESHLGSHKIENHHLPDHHHHPVVAARRELATLRSNQKKRRKELEDTIRKHRQQLRDARGTFERKTKHESLDYMRSALGGSSFGEMKAHRNRQLALLNAQHGQRDLTAIAAARQKLKTLKPHQKEQRRQLEHIIRDHRRQHRATRNEHGGLLQSLWKGSTNPGKKSVETHAPKTARDLGSYVVDTLNRPESLNKHPDMVRPFYSLLGGSPENKTKDYMYYKREYNRRLLAAKTVQEREELRKAWRGMRNHIAHSDRGYHRALTAVNKYTNTRFKGKLAAYRADVAKQTHAFKESVQSSFASPAFKSMPYHKWTKSNEYKQMVQSNPKYKKMVQEHGTRMRTIKAEHLAKTPDLLDSRGKVKQKQKAGALRVGNVQAAPRAMTRKDLKKLIAIHYDAWNQTSIHHPEIRVSLTHALQRKFQENLPDLVKTVLTSKAAKAGGYAATAVTGGIGLGAIGAKMALSGSLGVGSLGLPTLVPAVLTILVTKWAAAKVGAAVQENPEKLAPALTETLKYVGAGASRVIEVASIAGKVISVPAKLVTSPEGIKKTSRVIGDLVGQLIGHGDMALGVHHSNSNSRSRRQHVVANATTKAVELTQKITQKALAVLGIVVAEFLKTQIRYYLGIPALDEVRFLKVLLKHRLTISSFLGGQHVYKTEDLYSGKGLHDELTLKYLFIDAVDAIKDDALETVFEKMSKDIIRTTDVAKAQAHKQQKRKGRVERRLQRRQRGGEKGFAGYRAPAKRWWKL